MIRPEQMAAMHAAEADRARAEQALRAAFLLLCCGGSEGSVAPGRPDHDVRGEGCED